jgi:uncharacterized protein YjbI with pentapeptide repeats
MASKKQLALLRQSIDAWNEWRREHPKIKPNLRGAHLIEQNLMEAYLAGANLVEAYLCRANLNKVNLVGTNLRAAQLREANLVKANLRRAYLSGADLREANVTRADLIRADLVKADCIETNFSGASLRGANLMWADLSGANFNGTDLSGADLSGADLSEATFQGACLEQANLTKTHVLATNFNGAKLTGACLEAWNIDSGTQLDKVICNYVYLKSVQRERRPSHESEIFAPGEFTKLFQKALETVDLIFRNGIDWQSFLTSFQKLQVECGGDELFIQAIENKNDGVFVIRVNVPHDANKAEIENYLKKEYEFELKFKDEMLQIKDDQIAFYREQITVERQKNTDLLGVIKTMANQENSKYYFHQPQIGSLIDTARDNTRQQSINNQHNYAAEQKQSIVEVVAELQQLMSLLAQKHPATTEAERQAIVAQAIRQKSKSNPTFKERLLSAVKAGSIELVKVLTNNLFVSVSIETFRGWIECE